MVDPTPRLIGTDPRFFLDDQPLHLPDPLPDDMTFGLDLSSHADMTGSATYAPDWSTVDRLLMFGDGTGRPIGGLLSGATAYQLPPGAPRLMPTPPHPGHMTRQRRRAAARAAAKGRTI